MIATPAQHRKQQTEMVRLMEAAKLLTDEVPRETSKKSKLHRAARPGIPGLPLPHYTRGTLVRRRHHA